MKKEFRYLLFISMSVLATLAVLQPAGAFGQTYPAKWIRLVLPWPPGTPADVAGRVVAEGMSTRLGQPLVVENRPGATGTIGLAEVGTRQPADGYTIYMLSSPTLLAPLLYRNVGGDFLNALDPVGHVAWSYNVLVVPVTSTFNKARDIVAAAQTQPNSLNFASGGNGTPAHLAGEMFKQQTGISTLHVPYNQFSMAVGDVISGRVHYMFLTASAAIPQIAGGKLKAIAVTSRQRLSALPDTPTMIEEGFADFLVRNFDGMMVRRGTPRKIIESINAALVKTVTDPKVRDRLGMLALESEALTPDEFGTVIAKEYEKWIRLGKAAGVKAD